MVQSFTTTLHRSINGYLAMMTFILVLLLSLVFAGTYFRDQQLNQKSAVQFSQLKQEIIFKKSLVKTHELLTKILSDKQAESFKKDHQKLIIQWSILNGRLASNSPQFDLWLADNKKNEDLIDNIVSRSEDNEYLLKKVIEQLKNTNKVLTNYMSKNNHQLRGLYQLVIKDNVNDSVTVNRAKAYIKANTTLDDLKILKQEFETTIESFEQLTIKTSSSKFEKLSQQILATLALYEFLVSESTGASSMLEVNEYVTSLKLLLFAEQQTVAKWRSYLQLIHYYRAGLQKQFDVLQSMINAPVDNNKYKFISKKNEKNLFFQLQKTLTLENQAIVFWIVFVALCLLFICLAISISHKYKTPQQSRDIEVLITDRQKKSQVAVTKVDRLVEEVSVDKGKTCFDMMLYTKHQGTIGLAIYMLDEYIESNDESFSELCHAIKVKNKPLAEQALMVLMENARILAADQLVALILQLEKGLAKQAIDKITESLLLTKHELTVIKKYATGI